MFTPLILSLSIGVFAFFRLRDVDMMDFWAGSIMEDLQDIKLARQIHLNGFLTRCDDVADNTMNFKRWVGLSAYLFVFGIFLFFMTLGFVIV